MLKNIFTCMGKGGVGKTTIAVEMTKYIQDCGYKVILMGLDQQQNHKDVIEQMGYNIEEYQLGTKMTDFVDYIMKNTGYRHVSDYVPTVAKDFIAVAQLSEMLHQMKDDYDYVVLDFPPNHSGLTMLRMPMRIDNAVCKALMIKNRIKSLIGKKDPAVEKLEYIGKILQEAKIKINKGIFFPLAIPTELGILEAKKSYAEIVDLKYKVGKFICNFIPPIPDVECQYCNSRYHQSNEYLENITEFAEKNGSVCIQIPFVIDLDAISTYMHEILGEYLNERNKNSKKSVIEQEV